ncbi:MAG: EcsC family protein [Phenylobacterium sp.]|uniref:EcsC family protein n=1 Tax=Phenylobacterium sp. TaxID=1871053 RepID=UPI00391BC39B
MTAAGAEAYERNAAAEAAAWRAQVLKPAGALSGAARALQQRINRAIPERVHKVVTAAIEQMTRAILTGSGLINPSPIAGASLQAREARARERIAFYRTAAAAEGGVTGAGGFLMAAADFPAFMAIKVKMLFELAAIYGHPTADFGERLYILHIFQLTFSSPEHRRDVLGEMTDWDARPHPQGVAEIDWRRFQQEYRDYIDLAKLAQLLPVVGAPVGAVVNFRLTDRLGETAMNAYRLRWFAGRG